jgi:ABC-type sugar transport system permease subunit
LPENSAGAVSMSRRFVTLMLLPALLIYTLLFVGPTLYTFVLSFYELSGFGSAATFVGLGNYARALDDPIFHIAARNSLLIVFVGGFFVFLLAFLFSISLSSGMAGKRFFRAVLFFPFIISVFAVASIFRLVYEPRNGMFNSILKSVGLDPVAWTAGPNLFWAMLLAMVWTYVGFYVVLLLAGIDKVPRDLYEAAELQGANEFQKFRFVTLPMIWDIVVISFVIWIIASAKNFEFPYAFGGLNIPQDIYNTSVYMYVTGFGQRDPIFQLGYASAIGVITIVVSVGLVWVVRRFLSREVETL